MTTRKVLTFITLVLTLLGLGVLAPVQAAQQRPMRPSAAVVEREAQAIMEQFAITERNQQIILDEAADSSVATSSLSRASAAPSGVVSIAATPNGCSFSPDRWFKANFLPACNAHDYCYASRTDRKTCDQRFYARLLSACAAAYGNLNRASGRTCAAVATQYYGTVRTAGWFAYKGSGRNN